MQQFIGKKLKDFEQYCALNNIKYSIEINSNSEKTTDKECYVTQIVYGNVLTVVVSQFKIGV